MELVDGQLSATFRLHIPEGKDPGIAGSGFILSPVYEAQGDRMRGYFEQPPSATTERFTFVNLRFVRASESRRWRLSCEPLNPRPCSPRPSSFLDHRLSPDDA
jgi:hypothetical protein